jgi:hypothetical protein
MTTFLRCTLLVALIAATGLLQAEQPFDPATRAKAIAPFIGEQTVAVVHVDLTRIEVDPLLDKIVQLVPEATYDVEDQRADIEHGHAAFLKAGSREIYYVVSVDFPRGPTFGVIPHAESVDVDALIACVGPPPKEGVIQVVKGALLVGDPHVLERVKTMEPDPRGELARAFEAAGDTAAQVLLLPPAHARRVIEEMMPTLPEEISGGPSTILTEGLLWAALGVDAPPKMSLRLVIQSQDKEAAAALRSKWLAAVRFLSAQEEARKRLRNIEEAAALLTPEAKGDRLVLTLGEPDGSIRALLAAIAPPFKEARTRAQRTQSVNQLKQLGLAMHNYHDVHGSFPAVGSTDADGNLLLSWRVHILPFVEQQKLYDQFHLDEPWDSEHNRKLIAKMPAEAYRCPASKHRPEQGLSTYRVVSGEGTVFPGREGIPIKEIKDGTSNTIMIVEVDDDHAVIWTKPEGLPLDPANPARGLGGQFQGGFDATLCDGSVQFFKLPADEEMLRRLFLRADGEPIEW